MKVEDLERIDAFLAGSRAAEAAHPETTVEDLARTVEFESIKEAFDDLDDRDLEFLLHSLRGEDIPSMARRAGLSPTAVLGRIRAAEGLLSDALRRALEHLDGIEDDYRRIGWWKGPDATPQSRDERARSWRARGAIGARWLARRLRQESHIDLLDGAAAVLADLGEASLGPIIAELEREPTRDQAEALLKALGWLAEGGHDSGSQSSRLERALDDLLSHGDPDLRARAADAARLLPSGLATD